jgi:ribonuclease-3
MGLTMADGLNKLQTAIGYRFKDRGLLATALRHASASADGPSNDRLEFLGDAVLELIIAERLFRSMPGSPEGAMTVVRSAAVSTRALARVATSTGLPAVLQADEGLRQRSYTPAVLAGAYEALIGAIFLDGGMRQARRFVLTTLGEEIRKAKADRTSAGSKSLLQELTQASGKGTPAYTIVRTEGPDHERRFKAEVSLRGERLGHGWGTTKKEAEQDAARHALSKHFPGWDSG